MKPTYILILLSLVITACGPTQRQLTATAAFSATPAEQATNPFIDPGASSSQLIANVVAHTGSVRRDITYCTIGNVALKMDMYFPKSPIGATPLAIFIHGGGWSKGDKLNRQVMLDAPGLLDAASRSLRSATAWRLNTSFRR